MKTRNVFSAVSAKARPNRLEESLVWNGPLTVLRLVLAMAVGTATPLHSQTFKPNILDPSYTHDRWGTSSNGIVKDFRAYRSSFDSLDDDDSFGGPDALGVPEWVAYEVKRFVGQCVPTHARPNKWITDSTLHDNGVMPDDRSYATTTQFRNAHPSWFARGHLAMKLLAERLGEDAEWNTHTFYNAVPQRQSFNAGIWLDLENLTGAWAQHYGAVWIVTGPIFADRHAYAHLGDPGEFPVAIPEALFKIVIRESGIPDRPNFLAFIYPQVGPGYSVKPFNHARFLTTVDEIEQLTGVDFLMNLPDDVEAELEKQQGTGLWPADAADFVAACQGGGD
ncbi:MAG TPA: DNA/RNA non-specific endonuclease [Sphingomicrobium sp.]|nr:DNA/RNA non-specific endonuclease [Sphingomicrobium sp.]